MNSSGVRLASRLINCCLISLTDTSNHKSRKAPKAAARCGQCVPSISRYLPIQSCCSGRAETLTYDITMPVCPRCAHPAGMRPYLRAVQSGRPIVTFAANSAFSRDIAHVLHPYTNLKKHQQNGPLIIARGEG